MFSSEHSLAIAVQEQAVAEHLVQAGCSTLVSVKTDAFWEDGPDGQLDGFCISLIDNVSEVIEEVETVFDNRDFVPLAIGGIAFGVVGLSKCLFVAP